jgi:hypothetical protein
MIKITFEPCRFYFEQFSKTDMSNEHLEILIKQLANEAFEAGRDFQRKYNEDDYE